MDRALYTSMSGMNAAFARQEISAQNMANMETPGFRAVLSKITANQAPGGVFPTRHSADVENMSKLDTVGSLKETGQPLDVALPKAGQWLAVQDVSGAPALTRMGKLSVSAAGLLQSGAALVQGESGSISVPAGAEVRIQDDGSVLTKTGGKWSTVAKLAIQSAEPYTLRRGDDGLFRGDTTPDAEPKIMVGFLEMANISPQDIMVEMIEASRMLDFQTQMLRRLDENAAKANTVLQLGN